eukprot:SAG25_NODE_313_length_9986_cov_6.931324_11_plen_66_part_00
MVDAGAARRSGVSRKHQLPADGRGTAAVGEGKPHAVPPRQPACDQRWAAGKAAPAGQSRPPAITA